VIGFEFDDFWVLFGWLPKVFIERFAVNGKESGQFDMPKL
jgi:hypothetical protein